MRRFAVLLVVLLLATMVVAVVPANAGVSCHNITAKGVGQDQGGGNTTAQIRGGGLLQGTTVAHFDITGGSPPILLFEGTITFTTNRGTLTASLEGEFRVGGETPGFFSADGVVTDADGKLDGAAGDLYFEGLQDLGTGAFTETITGEICVDLGGNGNPNK